jgi:hypothetical protein
MSLSGATKLLMSSLINPLTGNFRRMSYAGALKPHASNKRLGSLAETKPAPCNLPDRAFAAEDIPGSGVMEESTANADLSEPMGSSIQRNKDDTELFLSSRLAVKRLPPTDPVSTGESEYESDIASPVKVEIDAAILLQLLQGRRLCAADMRCLDCESKRCLLRLLLKACAREMANGDPLNFSLTSH